MNREKRTAIYSRLRELNPHPTTELDYGTAFELLISVILSAQATDVGVNKATCKLYAVANTPQAILEVATDIQVFEQAGFLEHVADWSSVRRHKLRGVLPEQFAESEEAVSVPVEAGDGP